MNVKGRRGGSQRMSMGGEREKEKDAGGCLNMLHYMFEDSKVKPTKYCIKRGKEEGRNGNIMEVGELFKVH
jgi:hypothetical protein